MAFHEQEFKKPDSELAFQFIDSAGNKYFTYTDALKFPLNRNIMIGLFYKELNATLNNDNLWDFIDTIDNLVLQEIEEPKKRGANSAKIRHLISELRERKDGLIREEILWKLFAAYYIREDENVLAWDEDYQNEKIRQFKKDAQEGGGLYDFFYKMPLKVHLPYAGIPPEELQSYLEESTMKMMENEALRAIYSIKD